MMQIPAFILGLVVNSAALGMICFRLKKWTESVIYMINLVFSDILLLFSLPFNLNSYRNGGDWHLGACFCQFVESLYFVNTSGTMLLMMLISLDRYVVINHPFKARAIRSPKKATIACTVLWLCVWSVSIPNYLQEENGEHCFKDFANSWWPDTIPLSMLAIFASVVIFCSVQSIRTLQRVDEERDNVDTKTSRKIISSNLVIFLVCFIPYHVALFLNFLVKIGRITEDYLVPLRVFFQISQCLTMLNSCLDAMYYYLIVKEFWNPKIKEKYDRNITSMRIPSQYIALELTPGCKLPNDTETPNIKFSFQCNIIL
ncbi:G-protein coupled receptor 35-like [Hemitrygon akajei]|uniref:G-protein coupled receptor 35-like n=1 Tax=Hemitrygon akajei TaxID=2704970 RepID=UPI003BF99A8D